MKTFFEKKIESQTERLTQSSVECTLLQKKCDDQDRELHEFRNKLTEKQQSTESHLSSITAQLIDREDQMTKVQDESSRRLIAIEQLEKELCTLQQRHDSAIKEVGRLESRLQAYQIDFQNDNKMLEIEVSLNSIN